MLGKLADWIYKPFLAYPDKTERLVYLLIFLFPIAGMSVRHWISNIFNALFLIGLLSLRKPREPLLRQEKVFLWICVAYFSMFIIAALGNGWGVPQTRGLGTETRFLFVIPLYLLVRRYPDCTQWLLRGSILGGFVLFGQAYLDVMVDGRATAWGIYSKNIIGPFAVLTAFWGLYYFWQSKPRLPWSISIFFLASVFAALTAAGLSGSRGGYVGFLVTGVFCIMFFTRPRWMFTSLIAVCLTGYVFYHNMAIVKQGVDIAVTDAQQYFQAKDHAKDASSTSSTGLRLEMLRTGLLLVRDNPVIGIGPGNYQKNIAVYIKDGKASPGIGEHGYPHNAFLEAATSKGLLGLVSLLLLFYYPVYVFIKGYKVCKPTAVIGLIHIVAISAFSLTDHSVVLMNNYTAILLLGMAIFFSAHIRACKQYLTHG